MADSGLPRSFLRPLLLVALRGGDSHGYELVEHLAAFGLNVDLAGVYRMLRTLEGDGLVSARWEPSNLGPPRRVYDLSREGEVATDEAYVELTAARDHLDQALMDAKVAR
jgi:PadR family transcriptional regulator, regulatory protein PadR